jgi:thiamine monophosphate kinase
VAAASHARLVIDLGAVPVLGGITPRDALASGEEYELLVTGPKGMDAAARAARLGTLTPIGRVLAPTPADGPGVVVLDGALRVDPPPGYDHLSPQ